jgi:hypothetical protein
MNDQDKRLEEVRQAFAQWRAQKEFSSQPIPPELWHQAISLMDFFPLARLAVALKVPIRSLEKQAALLRDQKPEPLPPANEKHPPESRSDQGVFHSLPLNVTRIDLPSDLIREETGDHRIVTISRNGCLLKIPYACPAALASTVVAAFVGGCGS